MNTKSSDVKSMISPLFSKYRWPALVMLLFGGGYLLLVLANHLHFGTSGWDLGIFQQTLFQYAHGELGPNTVRRVPTLLADHMEPFMFLLAPFWWIFREWTLLVVQVLGAMLGAAGVYAVIHDKTRPESRWYALAGMVLFFIHWSLVQALTFDYHNNVMGAMMLPWLLYAALKQRWMFLWILALLFLSTKETASLLLVALGLGMLFSRERFPRYHGAGLIVAGIAWYILSVQVLIPLFAGGTYAHWAYEQLGGSASEAIGFMVTHPLQTLSLLFDHEEKVRFWKYLLLSGGIFLLRWPRLLLFIIPLAAMKMFSSEPNHWPVWFHYQAELASLTAIAIGWTCLRLPRRVALALLALMIAGNLYITARMTLSDRYTPFYKMVAASLSTLQPWQEAAYKAMRLIPSDASVSAQNLLIPHLADRDGIYLFPDYEDADYILLHLDTYNVWPLDTRDDMQKAVQDFQEDGRYRLIFYEAGVQLYQKLTPE